MNAFDPAIAVVRASLDAHGRLLTCDPRLADVNARAGGTIGAPLALPPLATLVRLAMRLGVLISRNVTVADAGGDIGFWARAEPRGGGVQLAISGWEERPAYFPADSDSADFLHADATWPWEADGALRLTFVSSDGAARHGLHLLDLLGAPLTRLFAFDPVGDGGLPILDGMALRRGFTDQPARVQPAGTAVTLSAVPRLDRHGQFAGYLGSVREEEPVAAPLPDSGLAAQLSARLDAVLRLPLDRIIANADSINAQADGPLGADYVGYAADIAQAGRHLLGLVGDLADLEAVERPGFAIAAEEIDLADLARRSAGLLAVRAADARVRIDPPALDEVLPAAGDFRRVLQILVNLIGNALRYSPEGGAVWVRAEEEGACVTVTVADQGKGIAPADQVRIFEKFERVDTSEPGGSGLGLFIARRLARAMGGDITVDSAPGQGARFVLSLPRA